MYFISRLVSMLTFWLVFSATASPIDASQIYIKAKDALCLVVALDRDKQRLGVGSGFIIDQQGHVITNAHVIADADSVVLECGGKKAKVSKVALANNDIDLVKLSTSLSNTPYLNIVSSKSVSPGSVVFVMGNPHGLAGTITAGIVSGVRQLNDIDYLQMSAAINPGNSGGPVVNQKGDVIGIATRKLLNAEGIGFALVTRYLYDFKRQSSTLRDVVKTPRPTVNANALNSKFRFRDIPFGIQCNELIARDLLLANVELNGNSNQLLSGKSQSLMGQKTNVYYKCKEGVFVEGMYGLMPSQLNSVMAALNKKYGRSQHKQLSLVSNEYHWQPIEQHEIILTTSRNNFLLKYTSHKLINWLDKVQQLKAIENGEL